jgi:hypothetical protein
MYIVRRSIFNMQSHKYIHRFIVMKSVQAYEFLFGLTMLHVYTRSRDLHIGGSLET